MNTVLIFFSFSIVVARRIMAILIACQHQTISNVQENHKTTHGLVNDQKTNSRHAVSTPCSTIQINRFSWNILFISFLSLSSYKSRDEFIADVRLIFDNCEIFNEDDSPVGKAGHSLRKFFESRWIELTDKHSSWYQMFQIKFMNEWTDGGDRVEDLLLLLQWKMKRREKKDRNKNQ